MNKPHKKMGRPVKEVDWAMVEKLCLIKCTQKEICSILNISIDLLGDHCKKTHQMTFPEYYEEKSANGSMSIRRAQYVLGVEKLDSAMLRHLGKVYLDQKDGGEAVVTHIAISLDDVKKAMSNDAFIDVTPVKVEEIE